MVPNFTENKLKIIVIVVAVLILADLAAINFKVFSPQAPLLTPSFTPTPIVELPLSSPSPVASPVRETDCPSACLVAISGIARPTLQSTISPLSAREIYIPLGNGSTKSQEWVEIPGAEAVLDTANFTKIKSMIFEAFLRISTGNGKTYAKLYNVTDQHDVWFSEVWAEGSSSQRVESAEIKLNSGRKLYRVMMKTSMGYEAVLESARLKIILE